MERRLAAILAADVVGYLLAGILFCLSSGAVAQTVEDRPAPKFITSGSCASCHQDATSKWRPDVRYRR